MQTVDELPVPQMRVFYPLIPAATTDREFFKQVLRIIPADLPDAHVDFRHVATQDGAVVVGWDVRATHTGIASAGPRVGSWA